MALLLQDCYSQRRERFFDSSYDMAAAASAASESGDVTAESKALSLAKKDEGNEHHKAGRYGDAIDSYSAAIALDPASAALYSNRGASRMMVDQYAGAIADCDKAIELSKGFMKAYIRGATARLRIVSGRELCWRQFCALVIGRQHFRLAGCAPLQNSSLGLAKTASTRRTLSP